MFKQMEGITISKVTVSWQKPGIVILDNEGVIHRLSEEEGCTEYSQSSMDELHPSEKFHLNLISEEECWKEIREINLQKAALQVATWRSVYPELF